MPAIGATATPPALLLVAHGTASPVGTSTTRRLVDAVAAQRPERSVGLCFLDVALPALGTAVNALDGPTVLVPLLLSTGFHVLTDIPAAVDGHPNVSIARHLGPHPLLAEAMADRLSEARRPDDAADRTLMVAAGSTQASAAAEITQAAALLEQRLGQSVTVCTMADDLDAVLAALRPVRVVPYLLSEGLFTDRIAQAAGPDTTVAAPLGSHPAVLALIWRRYDDAVAQRRPSALG